MIAIILTVLCLGTLVATNQNVSDNFTFASSYQDNMVLQMKPYRAVIWGFGKVGATVNVTLMQEVRTTEVVEGANQTGMWRVDFDPRDAGGPYTIEAAHGDHGDVQNLILNNVLFGDVWICAGQSNMQYTVSMLENATEEITLASNYPNIRVMTPALVKSDVPLNDLQALNQPWSVANSESIGGPQWEYFSAVCWLYGRSLYEQLDIPIGLIAPVWGGTPIEPWSSQAALKKCGILTNANETDPLYPTKDSVIWNAMVIPLLKTTIKGVVWYQGESNAYYHNKEYNCSFPTLIQDWRNSWHEETQQLTNPLFPFGFVQLSSWDGNDVGLYASIRWHQTADYGYVPNDAMPNTFMAVAMDLGDPDSPFSSVHPRYKHDISHRLSLGALNQVYGKDVNYQGAIPIEALHDEREVILTYQSERNLVVREKQNFEICCNTSGCDYTQPYNTSSWNIASISSYQNKTVTLSLGKCANTSDHPKTIRYAWQLTPCDLRNCSLYSEDGIPAPPFIILSRNAASVSVHSITIVLICMLLCFTINRLL